jgi:hypothetical protein
MAGEVGCLAEVAINRGVSDIGDFVQGLQRLHDHLADDVGRQLGLAHAFQLAHDARDHPLDPVGIDRPLADGDGDRADQLLAVERRAPARPLDDGQLAQLHALEGSEATAALRAQAASTDRRTVFRRTAVLHLALGVAAEWASHDVALPDRTSYHQL